MLIALQEIANAAAATELAHPSPEPMPMLHVDLRNGDIIPVVVIPQPGEDDWIERAMHALIERFPDPARVVTLLRVGHTMIATDLATGETAEATF